MYELTEEAEDYIENGFPEERLMEKLAGNPAPISSLKGESWFSIGLSWAKKLGWVKVENGNLIPLVDSWESPARQLISKFKENPDEELIKQLLSRNLVQKQKKHVQHTGEIGELTHEILVSGAWKSAHFRKYDVSKPGKRMWPGKKQAYRAFLDRVRYRLELMGFQEMSGPIIETEFWNFDALFQPQNHPARDWTDTYQLKNPESGKLPELYQRVKSSHEKSWKYEWKEGKARRLMPRAHGTAISARTLASGPSIPGRYYAIARVFRPDVLDATHLVEFNQVEGIVLDRSLKFRHLLGVLKEFALEFAGAEKVRFLPDYYPFTEPSVQMSAKHPELGWVEFGGAGIFREELTHPLGVDVPVIAWGIGIDRLAMFRLGITDIRQLFSYNLQWLREAKVV